LGSDAGEFHGVEVWAESMKVRPVVRSMCCADTVGGGAHSLA